MSWNISRVSSLQFNTANRSFVASATSALATASEELSTGVKSDIYGALGASSATLMTLRKNYENTEAYINTNSILDSKLQAMLTSIDTARGSADSVLKTAIVNSSRATTGVTELQNEASAALESLIATLNISYSGDYLFSGIDSDKQPLTRWSEVNKETGASPAQVLADIVGGGPTSAEEAEEMLAKIDAVFSSSNADEAENYEGTFFSGTRAVSADGSSPTRVTARIGEGQALEYGVQANDAGIVNVIKGLAMLASVDVSTIEDDATYSAWMAGATAALSTGVEGMLEISAGIGFHQQVVENAQSRLGDLSLVQKTQISDYESVDPYEASTKVENLQYQLEASYAVSAKLSQLSLLDYL
ncbi:MAG: flagellin [Pseudodonghicola sp.]|uniref:flagellin n=1 Tax=Pseudodonghicola sp. TaxID=1969463 RepID=UPI003A976604